MFKKDAKQFLWDLATDVAWKTTEAKVAGDLVQIETVQAEMKILRNV